MKSSIYAPLLGALLILPAGLLHAIPLPDNSSVADPATAFAITNTGTGGAGKFEINNGANSKDALTAVTNGTGKAGFFQVNNAANNTYALQAQSNGPGIALYGYNTGTGRGGVMEINNAANTNIALYGYTNGLGQGGLFQINNTSNAKEAVRAVSNGTGSSVFGVMNGKGRAGVFQLNNTASVSNGVEVTNNGLGWSLFSQNSGVGFNPNNQPIGSGAGWFEITQKQNPSDTVFATSPGTTGYVVHAINTGFGAVEVGPKAGGAGWFEIQNPQNRAVTLKVNTDGLGEGESINLTNQNNFSPALEINNQGTTAGSAGIVVAVNGSDYAGKFFGFGASSKGVYISVPAAQPGLNVVSGAKTGIVATSSGARALYSEESSEVWFTDYGFGKLQDGKIEIALDPTFMETVNLTEPYHVFVQTYGAAELSVIQRTSTSFTVKALHGDKNSEFSYRLVAKRKGFEAKRLDRMEMADHDPNLFPNAAPVAPVGK